MARIVDALEHQPIKLKDLILECGFTQQEFADAIPGISSSMLKAIINKGYSPGRVADYRERIEKAIKGMPKAMEWLKANGMKTSGIWETSNSESIGAMHADKGQNMSAAYTQRMKLITDREAEEMRFSRLEVLDEFGFRKDPFVAYRMETADSMRLKRLLNMAVSSRAMIAVVASWGFGKTSALNIAFDEIKAHIVRLETPDKGRVVVSDIEKTLIMNLSNETCWRTKEVRIKQVKRILGESSKPVVLVLEEAHRMHGQTLRALKTFRELQWKGESPLFTVVLVGQWNPLAKKDVAEVRLRSDAVYMKGLTSSEIKTYINDTVNPRKVFDDDAVEAVSRLDKARNFLDLQEALITLMGRALLNGQKKVTVMEVFEVYGGGLKELMKRCKVTLPDLVKETGLSKTTLSLVTNNKGGTLKEESITHARDAVAEVLKTKIQAGPKKASSAG